MIWRLCLSSSVWIIMEGNPAPSPPSAPNKLPISLKSFASILQSSTKTPQTSVESQLPLIPSSSHHGEPALNLPQSIVDRLSSSFCLALVGKFSHGHPTMDRSRQAFTKLDLKGNFIFGHLDPKHILIPLKHEGHFHHLCLKELLYLDGFPMRISAGL